MPCDEPVAMMWDAMAIREIFNEFLINGKWEEIPLLEKITIVPINKTTQATSYGGKVSPFKVKRFQIRLYYSEFNDFILAYEGTYKKVKSHVGVFSHNLKLKVFDYSKGNGKQP